MVSCLCGHLCGITQAPAEFFTVGGTNDGLHDLMRENQAEFLIIVGDALTDPYAFCVCVTKAILTEIMDALADFDTPLRSPLPARKNRSKAGLVPMPD